MSNNSWFEDYLILPAARAANYLLEDHAEVARVLDRWEYSATESRKETNAAIDSYSVAAQKYVEDKALIPVARQLNALLEDHPEVTRKLYRAQESLQESAEEAPQKLAMYSVETAKLSLQLAVAIPLGFLNLFCAPSQPDPFMSVEGEFPEPFEDVSQFAENKAELGVQLNLDNSLNSDSQSEVLASNEVVGGNVDVSKPDGADTLDVQGQDVPAEACDAQYPDIAPDMSPVDLKPEDIQYPQLIPLPGELDFGIVTIGCYSTTHNICLNNSGDKPITVVNISKQCPEFAIKNDDVLPVAIPAGASYCFDVAYLPQNEGYDECELQLEGAYWCPQSASIFLSGEGTWETENVDIFTPTANNESQFFLSAYPAGPMDIKIWVDKGDGFVQCTAGWIYDAPSNSIIFEQNNNSDYGNGCPQQDDQIKIWYEMKCATN